MMEPEADCFKTRGRKPNGVEPEKSRSRTGEPHPGLRTLSNRNNGRDVICRVAVLTHSSSIARSRLARDVIMPCKPSSVAVGNFPKARIGAFAHREIALRMHVCRL